jgi:hypothetical protein
MPFQTSDEPNRIIRDYLIPIPPTIPLRLFHCGLKIARVIEQSLSAVQRIIGCKTRYGLCSVFLREADDSLLWRHQGLHGSRPSGRELSPHNQIARVCRRLSADRATYCPLSAFTLRNSGLGQRKAHISGGKVPRRLISARDCRYAVPSSQSMFRFVWIAPARPAEPYRAR